MTIAAFNYVQPAATQRIAPLSATAVLSVVVAAIILHVSALSVHADETTERPNIVFLLADDLGWTGLRCFGSDFYETPRLDGLAASGMRFTNAYSACTVCSPTRASIMTGMYPARLRLTDFIAGQNRPWAKLEIPNWQKHLQHKYVTLAEALQAAGYATAHVGKWHLGPRKGPGPYSPVRHGFEIEIMKPRAAKGYFLPEGFNQQGESASGYLTDYFTDQALEVIDRHRDRPFFLYLAYHTPHTPIQGRPDLVAEFQKKVRSKSIHKNPTYAAMVKSLDTSVGRILDRLKRHGIDQKTVVIFTSDNGGLTQRYGKHDGFTENLPLRRGKGSAYEGGVRVPTIVHAPNMTRPGSVCEQPIMSIDYYPTLLEVAEAKGDEQHNASMDGRSLVPLLKDPRQTQQRDLYWHYPHYHAGGDGPYSAICSNGFRLIEFLEDGRLELYDLSRDIGETTNLAQTSPDLANTLLEKLRTWRTEVGAQMPTPNPNFDPQRADQVQRNRKSAR